ncbi:ras-related protein Rab-38 [Tetranychus urticae]|uniref:Ras-related protein Rab n=1 Tax=Tetranychus urticae TaxID=32264 RepID=T1KXM9_TETUR|nr:ras-related protein Rab-38 [Tetranychus urticae]
MSADHSSSDSSEPSVEISRNNKDRKVWKILILGEVSVGKTSLIKRYVHNFFSQHYRPTIGVDFALKQLVWEDESVIMLQLWDIAGQERFESMNRVYYKGAVGSFILTDAANPDSFKSAVRWKKDFDAKVNMEDGQPAPSILLVNKCDLEKVGMASDVVQLHSFAQENGFLTWCYVSAKENIGIDDAAKTLIRKILARIDGDEKEKTIEPRQSDVKVLTRQAMIDLTANRQEEVVEKSKCSC